MAEIKDLTTDEKIRLLNGVGSWNTYDCHGKINALTMSDGPHGLRKQSKEMYADIHSSKPATCFPCASTLACSFDKDMAALLSDTLSKEAIKEQIDIVLGPGVNIKRSPLCGRNFEYFSEDPYLAGQLATSYVQAMENNGVMSSVKHYALNNQETNRMISNSVCDLRTMHEIYLAPFRNIIKNAEPSTIMASYNQVNGTHASANQYLLKEVLRNKYHYKGMVMSDWSGAINIVQSIKGGLDLEMPDSGNFHSNILKNAYNAHQIDMSDINTSAQHVLNTSQKINRRNIEIDYDKHHEIATEIARNCAVLLKNNGLLPLDKSKKILIVGDLAHHVRIQGSGSSHIHCKKEEDVIRNLKDLGYDVTYAQGYFHNSELVFPLFEEDAISKSKEADIVLYFCGLTDTSESEAYDRKHMDLPLNQISLLSYLPKDKTVMICFGGSPFIIPYREEVNAILMMYLSGQGTAKAIADIISGKCNPSGKLAETWPLEVDDTPCFETFGKKDLNILYKESIFVGYRYYDSYHIPVQYEFGYGLSYTSFKYDHIKADETHVEFDLTNTGETPGKEISEVYVVNDQCVKRAHKELAGFAKTSLEPHETKHVSIEFRDTTFEIFDVKMNDFVKIKGHYIIEVNASLSDVRLSEEMDIDGMILDKDPLALYPSFDEKPKFTDEMFASLFEGSLPLVKDISQREYTISDSFEMVFQASSLGRFINKVILKILELGFKGGKKSPTYKLTISFLLESPIESLRALSNNHLPVWFMYFIVKRANKEKKGK